MLSIAYNKKIGKEVKKAIQSHIYSNFPATERYNADYSRHELLDVIMYSVANEYFIEEGSELLKMRRKKVADGDTVFYRIKPTTVSQVLSYSNTINEQILTNAKSLGVLNKPCICGLDWHDLGLYSKKIREAVRTKPKDGTDYALRYLSIESVEEGKRFTFHAVPINPFTNLCDAVSKLISKTREYIEIKLLLMDRAFFNADMLEFLIPRKFVPHIIPARRNKKIDALERAVRLKRLPIPNTPDSFYVVDNYPLAGRVKIKLVFYFTPSKEPDKPDKCFIFTTNLKVDIKNVKKLADLYRKRWGIETGYRVKDRVLGRTCSTNYVARLLFLFLSILLYNFWTLLRILKPPWTRVYKRFTLNKLKKLIRECIEFGC